MTPRTPVRRATGAAALALLVLAVLVALATPAAAHVDGAATTDGSGTTRIVLSFTHGCEGEPTTTLRTRVPDGATDVVAEDVPGWTSTVEGDEVRWTGGSAPDGQPTEFAYTARLAQPDGAEVSIPTIQECPTLSNDWIEPPTGDESEASSPAPIIVVPAGAGGMATDGGTGDATEVTTGAEPRDEDDPPTAEASQALPEGAGDPSAVEQAQSSADDESAASGGTAGLIVFLVVMAILIGGGLLLYLRNRRPPSPS